MFNSMTRRETRSGCRIPAHLQLFFGSNSSKTLEVTRTIQPPYLIHTSTSVDITSKVSDRFEVQMTVHRDKFL